MGGRQSAATATGGTPKVFIIAIYVFTMINRADGDAQPTVKRIGIN